MTKTDKSRKAFLQNPPLWFWIVIILYTIFMVIMAAGHLLMALWYSFFAPYFEQRLVFALFLMLVFAATCYGITQLIKRLIKKLRPGKPKNALTN